MDANAVLNSVTRNVLYQVMVASRNIDIGDIEPDELSPDAIGRGLDLDALLQIQKALRFARIQMPVIMRRAQENANNLIRILAQERQLWLAEKSYDTEK